MSELAKVLDKLRTEIERRKITPSVQLAQPARTIYVTPAVDAPLQQLNDPNDSKTLDKFSGVAAIQGLWCHPYKKFTIDITEDMLHDIARKWNTHRHELEIFTPDGHTQESAKNKGYIDPKHEAKVVDVEFRGEKRKGLEFVYDIRDPDTAAAAKNKCLKRSIALHEDYRISRPDGTVVPLGIFPHHVAFTSDPVQAGLPDLEPFVETASDPVLAMDKGVVTEFVPLEEVGRIQLASRLVTYQDPPADIVNGSRKATHKECGYSAGVPGINCGNCLAFQSHFEPVGSPSAKEVIGCDWVEDPVTRSGVCKFHRPRTSYYARELENSSNTSSHKLGADLESDPNSAGNALNSGANMDLKALAKELNLSETDDPKAFVKSVKDATASAVAKAASDAATAALAPAIASFAKALGVETDGKDALKAAEAVKVYLAKPPVEAQAQLTKEVGDLKTELARLSAANTATEAKNANLAAARELDQGELEHAKLSRRFDALQASGRATKADVTRALTIGHNDKKEPLLFAMTFDRSKDKYDENRKAQLSKINTIVEYMESLPEHSAVPKEGTAKVLSRHTEPPADDDDAKAERKKMQERAAKRAERVNPKPKRAAAAA